VRFANSKFRYIYITHSTDQHLNACGDIAAPLGKVCSIVQGEARMHGTQFMSKSLAYIWCWLGTKPYWGIASDDHRKMLEELAGYIDSGKIKSHLTKRMKLTVESLRKGHELIEAKSVIGKIAFGVEEEGRAEPFT
jgi:NADPH:quinone reductase-like Zn-dependent oxidoreductase